jgi:hypothetical protein
MTSGRPKGWKNREPLKADNPWAPAMGDLPSAIRPGRKGLGLSCSWVFDLFGFHQLLEAFFECPPG